MLKLKNKFLGLYSQVVGSIAFYPSLVTLFFVVLAVLMLQIENYGISKYVTDKVQYIIVNNKDTARTILTTIVGGVMSIMVFSFSMVMLLLSQASSNFSPRVLPSLIANKKHQLVLGFFIGTIVYCLLVTMNILPDHRSYSVPGVATFVGVILGLHCLALFVYFLHSISRSIQIGYILETLYKTTLQRIEEEIDTMHHRVEQLPDDSNWENLYSNKTGYLQDIVEQHLKELAEEHETSIHILVEEGRFIIEGEVVGKVERDLDATARDMIVSCLLFSSEERIAQNLVYGIKQITEIIVKAMSPGINDPGTALIGIDYLSELFIKRMHLPDNKLFQKNGSQLEVGIREATFEHIFYLSMVSIRQYVRHDVVVILKLIDLFKSLLKTDGLRKDKEKFLRKELASLMEDVKAHIKNTSDQEYLVKLGAAITK